MDKICAKCNAVKPIEDFYRSGKAKDGHQTWCKACQNEKRNQWNENPIDINEKQCKRCFAVFDISNFYSDRRNRDGKRPYCKKCDATRNVQYSRATNLRRLYGLELDDYDRMYNEQKGVCPICERVHEKLYVDHNHDTDKIRGLLCNSCNRFAGWIEKDIFRTRRVIAYLELN